VVAVKRVVGLLGPVMLLVVVLLLLVPDGSARGRRTGRLLSRTTAVLSPRARARASAFCLMDALSAMIQRSGAASRREGVLSPAQRAIISCRQVRESKWALLKRGRRSGCVVVVTGTSNDEKRSW
jgi:hypothetical protein